MPSPLQQQQQRSQRSPATWTTTTTLLLGLTIGHSLQGACAQNGVDCYGNLNTIALREGLLSATDLLQVRSYTLCSGVYTVGTLNYDNELVEGQDMLALRSNLRIRCGESGSRDNNCIINGGDVQVDGTNLYSVPDGTVDNVILEGLTFTGPMKHMVHINKPGGVIFKDCVFRVRNIVDNESVGCVGDVVGGLCIRLFTCTLVTLDSLSYLVFLFSLGNRTRLCTRLAGLFRQGCGQYRIASHL
jgi:hypothetical protein